ncbi:MAG TPA: hypothetical protein VGI19_07845 [Candidatus Cybelea sp.]|jgi:hypothetical protein
MKLSRAFTLFVLTLAGGVCIAPASGSAQIGSYPAIAPLSQYLVADRQTEIALARSAAPPSISEQATILVFTSHGYETAEAGSNGFTCFVERSWNRHFDDPQFWNWHHRAPVCMNLAASRSILPYYLFRTNMVLRGVPKAQMFDRIKAAVAASQLPGLELGSMAYMMSKEQYLTDLDPANGATTTSWHPHVMFYAPSAMLPTAERALVRT